MEVGGTLKGLLCLVLNKSFMPFDVISWQKALTLEFLGRCLTLEYHPYRKVRSVKRAWDVPIVVKVNSIRSTAVMGVPTRMMIYYRDNFRCAYCGRTLRDGELTIDHIVPKAKGGKWSWDNLVTCCRVCNVKKKEEIWVPKFANPVKPKFLFPKYIKLKNSVDDVTRDIWVKYIPETVVKAVSS